MPENKPTITAINQDALSLFISEIQYWSSFSMVNSHNKPNLWAAAGENSLLMLCWERTGVLQSVQQRNAIRTVHLILDEIFV